MESMYKPVINPGAMSESESDRDRDPPAPAREKKKKRSTRGSDIGEFFSRKPLVSAGLGIAKRTREKSEAAKKAAARVVVASRPPHPPSDSDASGEDLAPSPKVEDEASARAGGRLEDRAEFPEVRDHFETLTPQQIDAEFRPPHAWDYAPEEIATSRDYYIARAAQQKKLKSDKLYRFLVLYAAFTGKNITKMISSPAESPRDGRGLSGWLPEHRRAVQPPSGFFQQQMRAPAGVGPGAPITGAPTGTPGSPPSRHPAPPYSPKEAFVSSSPPPPSSTTPPLPSGPPPPPPSGPPPGPPPPGGGARSVPFLPGAVFPGDAERVNRMRADNSERMYSIGTWMEQPHVLGIQSVSPVVIGHVHAAFARLKAGAGLSFDLVRDFNVLINTEVDEVRTHFARLCSFETALTEFFHPTRVTYDRNEKRIRTHMQALVAVISKYRWDPYKGDFDPRADSGDESLLYGSPKPPTPYFLPTTTELLGAGDLFLSGEPVIPAYMFR